MPELVGRSPAIDAVRTFVAQAARTEANVLITGETGTGKEHVARLIHGHSSRRTKPLAIINCAAIPDGLLESELFGYERGAFTGAGSRYEGRLRSAHAGTTFLDEIGDMSLAGQAKLLRVIETKEIQRLGRAGVITADIRIIAATNGDLERMIVEGKFRADLYYRLAVARVRLPALRERPEDIAVLAQHYVDHYSRQFGRHGVTFTPAVLRVLWRYTWPGNVRELRNIVEAVFVAGPPQAIDSADLPSWFPQHLPHGDRSCAEREALLLALSATKSNKSKAAQHLNVSRMTLYRRLAKYQLTSQSKNEASR
jgi:transcriptional regulator with PAS, ATPase and Fis domain